MAQLNLVGIANRIGVSVDTARAWCRFGVLPATQDAESGDWSAEDKALDHWLDSDMARRALQFVKAEHRMTTATTEELLAFADAPDAQVDGPAPMMITFKGAGVETVRRQAEQMQVEPPESIRRALSVLQAYLDLGENEVLCAHNTKTGQTARIDFQWGERA